MDTQQTPNRSVLEPLKIAASLLTRWSVKIAIPVNETDQGKSVAYYPLVGLLIGALLYTCAYAATTLLPNANPLLLAVILVSIWVAITGALH
jgi:adenosylcobinamide-GDP ribazoletransferase